MSYLSQSAVEFSALGKAVQKALETMKWRDYYWYQLKYDGVSGIVLTGLPGQQGQMLSRTGEVAKSCDHIVAECQRIFGYDRVLFGEVYKFGWDQPEISGAFRRHTPQPELQFVVFDAIWHSEWEAGYSERIYSERHLSYSQPIRAYRQQGGDILSCAETRLPGHTSDEDMAVYATHHGGFDGYIRRDPRSSWTPGKDKRGVVLKFKPTVTFDLELIGTEEGKGRNKGRVGALLFRFRGDKVVKAGAIPDELRDNPPALGTIHEIEAMSESTQGVLREPRYKGQRFDKDRADF